MTDVRVTSSGVAVSGEWLRPMADCPVGAKVQLLGIGGVLVYGMVTEKTKDDYLAWYPLPRKPDWLIEKMSPTKL